MNPFDDPGLPKYDLKVENFGGALHVDGHILLDILAKRAMLCLRLAGSTNASERTTDFHRGQFAELHELHKAIEEYVRT